MPNHFLLFDYICVCVCVCAADATDRQVNERNKTKNVIYVLYNNIEI